MMVQDFQTKSMMQAKVNPKIEGLYLVGMDIGYSGCKIFSQNKVACFPAYAKEIEGEMIVSNYDDMDIWYQDAETKKVWAVGQTATNMMSSRGTNDNTISMYSRNRYDDPMFQVILRTGLGLGMMKNLYGSSKGKELFVQTGLPAAYAKDDTELLKDAFCKHHKFALKVGNNPWEAFDFVLDNDHVLVTSQPMGTISSVVTGENGEFMRDRMNLTAMRTLVLDAGFNTLDLLHFNNKAQEKPVTFDDLAMKQIFTETAKEISDKYNETIEIPYMQQILKTGIVQKFERKTKSTHEVDITSILKAKNKLICDRAIAKISTMYNDLRDLDYLIVTGGTGEAWWNYIVDELKNMKTLTIYAGNENSGLPFTFSNVRGYYLLLYRQLNKAKKPDAMRSAS